MIAFSVYDLTTGRIKSAMTVSTEGDRDANVPVGCSWIDGFFDPSVYYVSSGEAVPYPPKPAPWMEFDFTLGEWVDARDADDLNQEKQTVLVKLKRHIENQRKMLITDLPGQEMIYLRKEKEGREYLALDPEPTDLSNFPMLAAEVGITAPTAYQVAMIWVSLSDIWVGVAAQIEAYRLSKAVEIENASTFEALASISESIG